MNGIDQRFTKLESNIDLRLVQIECLINRQMAETRFELFKWMFIFANINHSQKYYKTKESNFSTLLIPGNIIYIRKCAELSRFNFNRMFTRIIWIRSPYIEFNIGIGISVTLIVYFWSPIMRDEFSIICKVFNPKKGIMANIFTYNSRRIKWSKITNTNGTSGIKARFRIKDNGTFIGVIGSTLFRNG